MKERVPGEFAPSELRQEPRCRIRVGARRGVFDRRVPDLVRAELAPPQPWGQHRGRLAGRLVTGPVVVGEVVREKSAQPCARGRLSRLPSLAKASCPIGMRRTQGPRVEVVGRGARSRAGDVSRLGQRRTRGGETPARAPERREDGVRGVGAGPHGPRFEEERAVEGGDRDPGAAERSLDSRVDAALRSAVSPVPEDGAGPDVTHDLRDDLRRSSAAQDEGRPALLESGGE